MKKKIIPGLLLAIAALGMIFFGCDLFMSESAGSPSSSLSTYDPLVITGRGLNGEEVEIEFSTTRTGPRAVLTPQTGDSYVMRMDGRVISQGTIDVDEIHIIFHPGNGAPSFVGSYTRGENYITLFEIPDENGEITPGTSNPGGGASGGGGGASGGPTRPSYDVVARSPEVVISVFGSNAVRGAGNAVNLGGDTRSVTSNVSIYVPIVVESGNSRPVKLIVDSRSEVMIAGTGSLTVKEGEELIVTGGGTLRIAGAALNVSGEDAKLTVDTGTKLIITNEGSKPTTLNINDNGELAVNGGDIYIYSKVSVRSTSDDPDDNPATVKVNSGNVNVYSGGYLTIGSGGVFDLSASSSTRPPKLNISGTGVVEITEDGALTPPDALPANKYKSVTLRGGGEFIVPSGPNQTTLTNAIAEIKSVDRGTGNQGKVVVKLTGGAAGFYAGATTNYITVDSGAPALANTIPYTIRGQGKNTTEPNEILKVGIWLANDNITLEDVKIDIPAATNANTPGQYWSGTATKSYYQTAVLIGRDNGDPNDTAKPVSKNVTVKNCDITIGRAGLAAGIIVGGHRGETGNNIITTSVGAQNITIADNTVVATNTSNGAVVGLMIFNWEDSIRVTGNNLKASYGGADPGDIAEPNGGPAAAFFINRVNETSDFTGKSSITGNTLHGTTAAERYSFFINAMMPSTPSNIINSMPGTAKAIDALRTRNFGTKDSTWAAQGLGVHKKLYNALLGNVTNGLGLFSMLVYLNTTGTIGDYVLESYNIVNKRTTYISFWGYEITDMNQGYPVSVGGDTRGGGSTTGGSLANDTGSYNLAEGTNYKSIWNGNL
jgi:hypothetical protein